MNRRNLLGWCLSGIVGATITGPARATKDNAPAINAAIARTGSLYLQANRTYVIASPLIVPAGCRLSGDRTSIISPSGNFPAIIVQGRNAMLTGFTVQGDRRRNQSSAAHGIFVDWRENAGGALTIIDVGISNVSGSGIIALASAKTGSSGLTIRGCDVAQIGAHGIIAQNYIDNVLIEENVVRACGLSYPDRPGITASRYGRMVTIRYNRCYGSPNSLGNSVHGISLDKCVDATCYDNFLDGWSHGYGIEAGGVMSASIRNNQIRNGRYGIAIPGKFGELRSTQLEITNNSIEDMSAVGFFSSMPGGDGLFLHEDIIMKSNSVRRVTGNQIGIGALMMDVARLDIRGLAISDCTRSGISLIDCPNHQLAGLEVANCNQEGNFGDAGVAVRWLKVPAARRGNCRIDPSGVHGNGGARQVMHFER